MECSLSLVDDGELPWSDGNSIGSDDGQALPMWVGQATTTRMVTGQLSPISTEMEMPMAEPSSVPTMIHSASSTDSWSTSMSLGEVDDADHEIHWEQGADEVLTLPKTEPIEEDDFHMDDLKEAPCTPVPESNFTAPAQNKAKRPRGRPRKHPLTPQITTNKIAKGRSKTGCITCRKRKKKCDEAKPRCMNCEKNAVVCEGYHEKMMWKSGRERLEEERTTRESLPSITIMPIFQGVETIEDRIFWKHYNGHLSTVLTVEGERKNAFTDILLQIAIQHHGLMHSILALSSKHIDYNTPYGMKVLQDHPRTSLEALQARSDFHHSEAMRKFYEDIAREENKDDPEYKVILSARYGQMLCLLLQTLVDGNPRGEHRVHLQAYKTLIKHSPPEDPAFLVFISEFFQYYTFADELTRYPDNITPRLAREDWEPWLPVQPARLLGVADGLFKYMTQITTIRNTIRLNMAAQIDPVVDYTSLYRAAEIDAAIREWSPHWPPGDSREKVALLYKQMMWVYLFRTIYPPSAVTPSTNPTNVSSAGVVLSTSRPHSPTTSIHSIHSVHSVHSVHSAHSIHNTQQSDAVNRPGSSHSIHSMGADSPPPIRYPPHHDTRITVAVDESLAILDSFKPSDPCQTLLLIPCVIIGCACFAPSQQERIRNAIRAVRGYTGLRNGDRVLQMLEEVWLLMDHGEWARVWDWQGVARNMDLDFSCA